VGGTTLLSNATVVYHARDAEPSITGDPANPQTLAALAFTPDPGGR